MKKINHNTERLETLTPETLDALLSFMEIQQNGRASYADQVWNRFNWFLTLQLAVVGFFFSQLELLKADLILLTAVPTVGMMGAAVWLLMGFEDFKSLRRHNQSARELEEIVSLEFRQRGVEIPVAQHKTMFRFRQNWLLFAYAALFTITWIVLYVYVVR